MNHPVRLRLPPLQRRGMYRHYTLRRNDTTIPSGSACHPSEGEECTGTIPCADTLRLHDLYIHSSNLWKPKPYGASDYGCAERHFRADMLVRPYGWFANIHGASGYGCTLTILFQQPLLATTPSGCACHPSRGGELTCADTQRPPRQAAPATPPKEGNVPTLYLAQTLHDHPVRLNRTADFSSRSIGVTLCRTETRCVCTNKIVHQLIYGNQNHTAQAITAVQNDTLGRTC